MPKVTRRSKMANQSTTHHFDSQKAPYWAGIFRPLWWVFWATSSPFDDVHFRDRSFLFWFWNTGIFKSILYEFEFRNMNIFDSGPYFVHTIWSIQLFCFHMSLISEGIRIIRDTKGFTYVMYLSRRFFFFIQKINSNANGHLTKIRYW